MADLTSKIITPGDPVTAEIINNLINDLNEVNKASTAQSIILQNTVEGGKSTSVSSKVYSQSGIKAAINPSNSPSGKVVFKFTAGWFTKPPRCWIQVNTGGAKFTEAQLRVHPVLVSVDTTQAVFEIRSGAGAAKATLLFDVFATEA